MRYATDKEKVDETSFMKRSGSFRVKDREGREWEIIERDGFELAVRKIDGTHFAMASADDIDGTRPGIWHIGQMRDDPEFYSEIEKWLSGREMIGGKSFNEETNRVVEEEEMDDSAEREVIVVGEDFRLPNTNIIIEKGEKIEINAKGKVEETTLDQHVRARYEELIGKNQLSPEAAVSVLVDEIPIPREVLLPMLQTFGYAVGPMDRR